MSGLLTVDMVKQAMPIVEAAYREMLRQNMLKRPDLYMVVLDPTKPFGSTVMWKGLVLYGHEFTSSHEWENPYDEFAAQKAYASLRTGMPSRIIRECAPHLLGEGNTVHGGSVVHDGLIVACSGVQPWLDEAIAGIASAVIRGIANEKMQMEIIPGGESFIS